MPGTAQGPSMNTQIFSPSEVSLSSWFTTCNLKAWRNPHIWSGSVLPPSTRGPCLLLPNAAKTGPSLDTFTRTGQLRASPQIPELPGQKVNLPREARKRSLHSPGAGYGRQYAGLGVSQAWVQIPALLLTSCVASGRLLNLSEVSFLA